MELSLLPKNYPQVPFPIKEDFVFTWVIKIKIEVTGAVKLRLWIATAEAVVAATVVTQTDENIVHTDVMLFNRWPYDDVSLTNHEIRTDLLEKMMEATQEFFKMPLEEKKKFSQEAGDLEGYGHAFVVSEDQKLEWADLFYVCTLPLRYRKTRMFNKLPVNYRSLSIPLYV
ncbi:hypothetical protein AgCh_028193 [Apium graveolens]